MSIRILPDPAHPAGGYAILRLGVATAEETTTVSIFDRYSEQFLGEKGWQSTEVYFGPYAVENGTDVKIGPEIVNQEDLEEYKAIRITVGDAADDTQWPDTVNPLPGLAAPGGMTIMAGEAKVKVKRILKAPVPKEEVAPEPVPAPAFPVVEKTKRNLALPAGLGLLVLALAAGAGWYLMQEEEPDQVATIERAPAPAPVPEEPPADPCAVDALASLAGKPFAETLGVFASCGTATDIDTAFNLIEAGRAAGDPDALLLYGQLYDKESTSEVVEQTIGVRLADDDRIAAQYYSAAQNAGASAATPLLGAVCERLRPRTDELSVTAVEKHCDE